MQNNQIIRTTNRVAYKHVLPSVEAFLRRYTSRSIQRYDTLGHTRAINTEQVDQQAAGSAMRRDTC